jgi:cation transport protein ChaC
MADPYAHHPELRGRIADPETSFFRTFSIDRIIEMHPHLEPQRAWAHTDAVREAIRAQALAGHSGDLWVFAYGSLIWDPALRFAELRRAHAPAHARRFVMVDHRGARGTAEAPGLMAGLDAGDGCEGLAFRIAAAEVDAETEILFRREAFGPGYRPAFVPVTIGDETVEALTFLADHACPDVRADLPRETQVEYLATGAGFLGTSRDYLAGIVSHLDHLGIDDPHAAALLRDVDARIAAR